MGLRTVIIRNSPLNVDRWWWQNFSNHCFSAYSTSSNCVSVDICNPKVQLISSWEVSSSACILLLTLDYLSGSAFHVLKCNFFYLAAGQVDFVIYLSSANSTRLGRSDRSFREPCIIFNSYIRRHFSLVKYFVGDQSASLAHRLQCEKESENDDC